MPQPAAPERFDPLAKRRRRDLLPTEAAISPLLYFPLYLASVNLHLLVIKKCR
jgi:hypothetical protein